jgi:hypothetical protein
MSSEGNSLVEDERHRACEMCKSAIEKGGKKGHKKTKGGKKKKGRGRDLYATILGRIVEDALSRYLRGRVVVDIGIVEETIKSAVDDQVKVAMGSALAEHIPQVRTSARRLRAAHWKLDAAVEKLREAVRRSRGRRRGDGRAMVR